MIAKYHLVNDKGETIETFTETYESCEHLKEELERLGTIKWTISGIVDPNNKDLKYKKMWNKLDKHLSEIYDHYNNLLNYDSSDLTQGKMDMLESIIDTFQEMENDYE